MDDTSTSDDVPEQSDWEYDSHYISEEEDRHPSDSQFDVPEYECRAMDNPVHMGEAIEFVFPVNMEYDVDGQEHIFEDGLDGDESEDSEASTNYEELTEPDVVCTVVEVTAEERGDEEEEDIESVDAADESYELSSDDADLYESGSDDEDSYESDSGETLNADVNVAEQPAMVGQQSSTPQVNPLPRAEINHPSPAPMILNQLLAKDLELKRQEKERDTSHWRLLELQEALRNIEHENFGSGGGFPGSGSCSHLPQHQETCRYYSFGSLSGALRGVPGLLRKLTSGIRTEGWILHHMFSAT
jgi:hypothetical protein